VVVVAGVTAKVAADCHVEPSKLYDAALLADAVKVDD
jgi:hypothetical protein